MTTGLLALHSANMKCLCWAIPLPQYINFLMHARFPLPCIPGYITSFFSTLVRQAGFAFVGFAAILGILKFLGLFSLLSLLIPGNYDYSITMVMFASLVVGFYLLAAFYWKDFATQALFSTFCNLPKETRDTLHKEFDRVYGDHSLKKFLKVWDARLGPMLLLLLEDTIDIKAKALRTAMKGLGTNESILVAVSMSFTEKERLHIHDAYRKVTKLEHPDLANAGRDLEGDLDSELGLGVFTWNHLSLGIKAMFMPVADARAWFLNCCSAGQWGTDERNLTRLLSLQWDERLGIAEAYKR